MSVDNSRTRSKNLDYLRKRLEFFLGIQSILHGERYLTPAVTMTVVDVYLGSKQATGFQSAYNELTNREREILKLVAEGQRTRQIAEYLCISPKTVDKHRANLMERLQIRGVSALTAFAIEKGLVSR